MPPFRYPLRRLWDFLFALQKKVQEDYAGLIAAGLSFYFLLATFPALAAIISLYGIFFSPALISAQLNFLSSFLPSEALKILSDQAENIAAAGGKTLGFSLMVSILFSIYAASKGVMALISGLNLIFKRPESRSFMRIYITALILTFLLMIYFFISLAFIAGIPVIAQMFPFFVADILLWARWPALFILALIGLEIIYRYGPSFRTESRNLLSLGSFCATVLWLAASWLFSLFVLHFGRYNQIYGALGAAVILLMWFWLSAFSILLGAEINEMRKEI
jgi:membrane protein